MNKTVFSSILMGVLSLQFNLIANPIISVDQANADAGITYSGDQNQVKHSFTLKNNGTSPLIIKRVKASCGCTAVGYDSIIQPGAEGKVTQQINLRNVHAGNYRKYITVFSNSKKDSILTLSLAGTIKSYVDVNPSFIQMTKDTVKDRKKAEVKITSTTEDLKITEVAFKSYSSAHSGPSWQSELPTYLKFELIKLENSKDTEENSFSLKIFSDVLATGTDQGRFIIKTNHPKKPEITVEGIL